MAAKIPSKIDFKDLSFFALFSLTFGSMMGSGVFDIPQNIANRAGAVAVILHWGIVAVGMIALAWSFVYISNKRPDIKSGIYGYAKFGFGDYVGFSSAWGYWLNALLGNASDAPGSTVDKATITAIANRMEMRRLFFMCQGCWMISNVTLRDPP